MPPAQNVDAKTASQQTHMNGGNKNANGVGNNGTKNNNTSTSNNHYSQQVAQSHNRRSGHQQPTMGTLPLESPSGAGTPTASHHYHHRPHNGAASATSQPTPLFERLVTEEYQELKAYTRIIEGQNRRLVELERIHGDLENRLELESRGRTQLEATLERRERDWTIKYHKLEKDRDDWKNEVSQEQAKNARLRDQVVRKDQDIHRMLQRKYDNQRESGSGQPIRNVRHNERQGQGSSPRQTHHNHDTLNKSPHEILATTGSMETVRIRNVKAVLADFFAL
jgi:hypothetical protein